jgi:hypothetical protein
MFGRERAVGHFSIAGFADNWIFDLLYYIMTTMDIFVLIDNYSNNTENLWLQAARSRDMGFDTSVIGATS